MFSSLTSIFKPKEHKVLMIGAPHSGKTTILYQMKLGEICGTIPTMGFNVESLKLHTTI